MFGERWINTIFDLFEENTRYFPALLPVSTDVDPLAELDAGRIPVLDELRLHKRHRLPLESSGVRRRRRQSHLRVENRVLPAGPTVVDTMANAAFYYGLVRGLVDADRPCGRRCRSTPPTRICTGARDGIDAQLYWPELGWVRPDELVLQGSYPSPTTACAPTAWAPRPAPATCR